MYYHKKICKSPIKFYKNGGFCGLLYKFICLCKENWLKKHAKANKKTLFYHFCVEKRFLIVYLTNSFMRSFCIFFFISLDAGFDYFDSFLLREKLLYCGLLVFKLLVYREEVLDLGKNVRRQFIY